MNIKRVKAQTIKTENYENLTERINKQINERAMFNSSTNYTSTPSSMQVKNIRSIDFQNKRNNQTALSVNNHQDRKFNGSIDHSRSNIKRSATKNNSRNESPI
jgi:hypothetical protein